MPGAGALPGSPSTGTREELHGHCLVPRPLLPVCAQDSVWGLSDYSDWRPSHSVHQGTLKLPQSSEGVLHTQQGSAGAFVQIADLKHCLVTALLGRARTEVQPGYKDGHRGAVSKAAEGPGTEAFPEGPADLSLKK